MPLGLRVVCCGALEEGFLASLLFTPASSGADLALVLAFAVLLAAPPFCWSRADCVAFWTALLTIERSIPPPICAIDGTAMPPAARTSNGMTRRLTDRASNMGRSWELEACPASGWQYYRIAASRSRSCAI